MSAATVMCVERLSLASSSVGTLRDRLQSHYIRLENIMGQAERYPFRPAS